MDSATNGSAANAGSSMQTEPAPTNIDDQLDRLVEQYAQRLAARADDNGEDLLARLSGDSREALARCFRLMRAGLVAGPREAAPLGAGVVLGGYRIERELGRGGMATVYLATQLDLGRRVALKVLRPGLAVEPRHVERFHREALAAARLKHAHIVPVFAVGEDGGRHWLAMEFVEGGSLADVYAKLPPAPQRTAEHLARALGLAPDAFGAVSFERALATLLTPLARALAATHELGLVHRDIKPSNILIARDGRAQLSDFGLAKGDGDPGLSLTGEPLGTPYYMSPEQATLTEHRVDARSDIYSFGVTLYEGLAGRCPFTGANVFAVLDALRRETPPDLRALNRNVSADGAALVARAMQREPKERYPSAIELAADCQALARGEPTQARARSGGEFARLLAGLRSDSGGYRSRAEFLGLPLVHINGGFGAARKRRVAKGWIAVGDVAIGAVAVGGLSCGLVSLGGLSAGLVSFGGLALGVVLALGGCALGSFAVGGLAVGYAAVGGGAIGWYALAGDAFWSMHAITGRASDPQALEFFRGLAPWLEWLPYGDVVLERLR